jgi:hypothetical protein
VLGLGNKWLGGDMNYAGGGFKVNLLKKELESIKDDVIVLFTDAYDVVLGAEKDEFLRRFKAFGADVVFGAEKFCWPKEELKSKYPEIPLDDLDEDDPDKTADRTTTTKGQYRFLNSGGFIGLAGVLRQMVNAKEIADQDDDQLFYTEIFLDEDMRKRFNIKLDYKAQIFQNLNGAMGNNTVLARSALF